MKFNVDMTAISTPSHFEVVIQIALGDEETKIAEIAQTESLQNEFDQLSTAQTINIPNPCTVTENMHDTTTDNWCTTQNFCSERPETFSPATIKHGLEKKWDLVPSQFRHRIRHSMCDPQHNLLELNSDTVGNVRCNNSTAHEISVCKDNTCSNVRNDLILVSRNDSQRYRKHHESDHRTNTRPVSKNDSLPMTCNRGEFQKNRKDTGRSTQSESSKADERSTLIDNTCSNPHSDLVLVSRDKTQRYRKQHGSEQFMNTMPATKTDLNPLTCNREEFQNSRKGNDSECTLTKSFRAADEFIPQKYELQQPTAMSREKCHINSCGGKSNKRQVAEFKPLQENKTGFDLQSSERVVRSDCTDKKKVKLASDYKVSPQRAQRKRHSSSQENTDIPTKKVNYTSGSQTVTSTISFGGENTEKIAIDAELQGGNASDKARSKKIKELSSKVTLKKVDKGKSNNKSLQCLGSHSRSKTSTAKHRIDVGGDQDTESEMLKLKAVDDIHKQIAHSDDKVIDYRNESVDISQLHELIPLDSNTKLGQRKVRAPNVSKQQSVLQKHYSTYAIWETVVSKYD